MILRLLLTILIFSLPQIARVEIINDFSKLNPIPVDSVISIKSETDVINAINYAKKHGKKVAISSGRNSQGGHIAINDGVVLDMKRYDRIVDFSPDRKIITVESGITWDKIQRHINSHDLSIKIMQSSNIFTVGGALGSNIHGRDPRFGTIIESVNSFRLATADGRIVDVSREENSELFFSVIGGYGLLGVITEVELSLTENRLLAKSVEKIDLENYSDRLQEVITADIELYYGRCSIVHDESMFDECVSVSFQEMPGQSARHELVEETNIARDRFFFNLSRQYDWGKNLRWWLQRKVVDVPGEGAQLSRNNAMRPPISFVENNSSEDTDLLQEYFIPRKALPDYLYDLKQIVLEKEINLLSMTIRYIPRESMVLLDYAMEDSVAVVLYISVKKDNDSLDKLREWTRELVDMVDAFKGKYYLTYHRLPTVKQFCSIYPRWKEFYDLKQKYDEGKVFSSAFFEQYFVEANKSSQCLGTATLSNASS